MGDCIAVFENVFGKKKERRYFQVFESDVIILPARFQPLNMIFVQPYENAVLHVAKLWISNSPKYLDRPWECSQLRQVWCALKTMLIQLFIFNLLSLRHDWIFFFLTWLISGPPKTMSVIICPLSPSPTV